MKLGKDHNWSPIALDGQQACVRCGSLMYTLLRDIYSESTQQPCIGRIRETAIPRRNRLDCFSAAERAIWDATQVIEAAGAHPLLTAAVNLLHEARTKVADYVELCPTCGGKQRVAASNPRREMAWEVPCPDCRGPPLSSQDRQP